MNRLYASLLAGAITVSLTSCDSNDSVQGEPFPVGSSFELESFATAWGSRSRVGGAQIRITFEADGRFRGRTFTSLHSHNTFYGTYDAAEGGVFRAYPRGMTQVNEPEGSRIGDFLNGLDHSSHFVHEGHHLLLFYGAGILDLVEVYPTLPAETSR